jgi:hypothetical protein
VNRMHERSHARSIRMGTWPMCALPRTLPLKSPLDPARTLTPPPRWRR